MQNEKIHMERIRRLIERLQPLVHQHSAQAHASFCYHDLPIPYTDLESQNWRAIQLGDKWGELWGSAWFKVSVTIPPELAGKELALWFDCDGEACVWRRGRPWQGLTPKVDWYHKAAKYLVPIGKADDDATRAGAQHDFLIEAAANGLFGGGKDDFHLNICKLVSVDSGLRSLITDISLLLDLALALPAGQVRRQRILHGLDRVCDLWETSREECTQILQSLLAMPANASSLTAYSVGHAHLDLAWLWPLRETKRKGGRSFANALRLMEEYPQYIFGASQAQLYKWMKEMYPSLYEEVKDAYRSGRWEVQGAGWVEFDTNLISGESIIRQLHYGISYFEEEFAISPRGLWLPDCFGFNANLPQFLVGCGLDWFMTQKLSWNESNTFPHHLFMWEGIDGSRILAHQMPTNDYNFSNNPSSFIQTEQRYDQSGICDSFLNLYGIGDGGGGPTREHIEYGIRQENLEGSPRFRFAKAEEFFQHLKSLDRSLLPKLFGELYLELHRGTYTTQGRMKYDNRHSERLLNMAEFIATLDGNTYPQLLREVWEDTLLLQFHDIIPGSSITSVYEDSRNISEANHQKMGDYIRQTVQDLADAPSDFQRSFAVINANSWANQAWLEFPLELSESAALDENGNLLPAILLQDRLLVRVNMDAWAVAVVNWEEERCNNQIALPYDELEMENEHVKVQLSPQGTLTSVILKEDGSEVLAAESNILKLWEDEPNNWGAWDINHFYRTAPARLPHAVRLLEDGCWRAGAHLQRLAFEIKIGGSTIIQTVELSDAAPWIKFHHEVDWKERHKMLRAHFFPAVHAAEASFEIAMGVLKRSTKPSNSFENAKFEVPAHRWIDLSQRDHGAALLNDCKYGHRVVDNEMDINLLRSPADVDPQADIHQHTYSYGFYPHLNDANDGGVLPHAHLFNAPPLVVELPAGKTLPALPNFKPDLASVKLETIKPAEKGEGIIIRFYEYQGGNAKAEYTVPEGFANPRYCDLRERPLEEDVVCADGIITMQFKPYEIKTLHLTREES